ncbi:MAG TPA: outer membrane beta-barrel protein [Longimicrobiaceae bacterium]|nr:outer membrane beta-barrel protein [Longimicrobiaceae bacterium]
MIRALVRSSAFAAAAAILAAPAHAQKAPPQPFAGPGITLAAGVMNFDLSGTGNTPTFALRADLPLSRIFSLEAAVAGARPNEQSGTSTILFPEVQLQAGLPLGRITPYAGAGLGIYRLEGVGGGNSDLTFSGGAGLRAALTERLGVVLDGRVHGIGTDFSASTSELTLGLRWSLGSH